MSITIQHVSMMQIYPISSSAFVLKEHSFRQRKSDNDEILVELNYVTINLLFGNI